MGRLFRKLEDDTEETIFDGDKWLPILNETQLIALLLDVVGELDKRGLTKKKKVRKRELSDPNKDTEDIS